MAPWNISVHVSNPTASHPRDFEIFKKQLFTTILQHIVEPLKISKHELSKSF